MATSVSATEPVPPLSGPDLTASPQGPARPELKFESSDSLNRVADKLRAAIGHEHNLDALIWIRPSSISDQPQMHPLVDRLPPGDRTRLRSQLDSVCNRASESAKPCHRAQLAPNRLTIAVPVLFDQHSSGVIGLILTEVSPDPSLTNQIRERLVEIAKAISVWETARLINEERRIAEHSAATVELVTKILRCQQGREAAQTIAAELDRFLPVKRVIVGFESSKLSGIRELVASDSGRIDLHSARATLLIDSMNESLRSGAISRFDTRVDSRSETLGARVAAEMAMHVTSMPLGLIPAANKDPGPRAVVLLAQDADSDCDVVERFATAAQDVLSTAFCNVATQKHIAVTSRLRERLRSNIVRVTILLAMFVTGTMFIPVTYRVSCDAVIEPKYKRFVVAPFDATLEQCFIQPGDIVSKGDRLAKLDERQLQWERTGLQADRDQAIKRRDSARASRKFAQQRIAQLEIDRINSELDWLNHRLSELEIISPIDGVVVMGDLTRASGAPLRTGEAMFEIAPLGDMLIELGLADHQVTSIQTGQSVTLRLDAYPGQTWNSRIDSISPRSEIRGKQSVFIGESDLDNEDRNLRPGMTGRVKVDCGKRRLGWVLFHRPWDSLVTWLFW